MANVNYEHKFHEQNQLTLKRATLQMGLILPIFGLWEGVGED